MTQYRFPIFFCSLFLCIVSCAQSQPVTGLDEPSEHDNLKRNIWLAAMGTSYDQAVSYTNLAQEQSQKTLTHELVLPTGWKIKPAGQVLELGSMPSEMVSFSNRLVILNNGFYPPKADSQVSVVNPFKNTLEKNLPFHSLFPSAVTGPDGNLYISGGYDFKVYRLNRQMKPTKDHSNYIVNGYAGGLAFTGKTRLALTYLMVNKQGTGAWKKGKIALLDTSTGKILDEIGTGHYPYALEWTRSKLYATIEGENRVQIYSIERDKLVEGASIPVGKNPTNLTLSQGLLYVVNSNSDEISVIDTQTDQAVNTFDLKQQGFKYGAGPNSVAADKDRLYVSLAGWNAVAVLNKVDGKLLGLIPAGWYPTKVYLDKKNLYVLSAKGVRPQRPTVRDKGVEGLRKEDPYYILNLLVGSLSTLPLSDVADHLEAWTAQVERGSPLESPREGFKLPIKHVFYVIRENRTYDQILGDLAPGEGDPKLCVFPEPKSPNAHKLARDFVTLDHFFCDGEISALGHSYTTSGYASPFLEWISNIGYAGRFDWKDPDDDKEPVKYLYPYGTIPAFFSPQYLWDAASAKGLDYKVYGEPYYLYTRPYRILVDLYGADSDLAKKYYQHTLVFANEKDRGLLFTQRFTAYYKQSLVFDDARKLMDDPKFTAILSDYYMADDGLAQALAKNEKLKDAFADFLIHYSLDFPAWNLKISDLERFRDWKADFRRQVDRHQVPSLEYLWLPNDHMGWPPPPTPEQYIAQNDAALGALVEEISKSDVWKNSLIFVVEDDSQDGLDHVDSTRTVALAAGPYVKRGARVSDPYDQESMLRTIELILGLEPMSSGDGLAVPMMGIFTDQPDLSVYRAPEPAISLSPDDLKLYRQVR